MPDPTVTASFSSQFVNAPGASNSPSEDSIQRQAYASAKAARDMAQQLRTNLADQYAQAGNVPGIGGKAFNQALNSDLIAEGLMAPPPSAPTPGFFGGMAQNLMSEKGRESMLGNLGYSAMSLGSGIAGMARLNAGQYVSPEQMQAAQMNAFLPFGASAAGTVIGTALGGPIGGLAGQFIGGAAGQAGSAVFGASMERAQAARETGDVVGMASGGSAQAVKEFVQALKDTHAPLKELQNTFTQVARMGGGGMSGAAVTAAGNASLALGAQYDWTTQTILQSLQKNPFLSSERSRALGNGGQLDGVTTDSLAVAFSAIGDDTTAAAYKQSSLSGLQNPKYNRDVSVSGDPRDNSPMGLWNQLARPVSTFFGKLGGGDWNALQHTLDDVSAADARLTKGEPKLMPGASAIGSALAKATESASDVFHDYQQREAVGRKSLDTDTAEFQSLSLRGASNERLWRSFAGIKRQGDSYVALGNKQGDFLWGLATKTTDKGAKLILENEAADVENKAQAANIQGNAIKRSLFERDMELDSTEFSSDVFDQTYRGQSARAMRGRVTGRRDKLNAIAGDPNSPMSDAERAAYKLQARQLDVQNHQAIYAQDEGQIDVRTARAQRGVVTAASYETPDKERAAQGALRGTLQAQEGQLNRELAEGNLSYDQRLAKMREIAGLQVQVTQNEVASRTAYFAEKDSIYGNESAGLSANIGRVVRRDGNAGINVAGIASADDRQIANARAAYSQAQTPEEQARYGRQIADLTEQKNAFLEMSNTYSPNAKDQQAQITMQGQMRRAMLMPYMDGPDSNRFAIGNRLMGFDKGQISKLNANRAAKMKAGTWHEEDQTTYLGQLNGLQNDIADAEYSERYELFSALPEMVVGAPQGGVGVSIMPTKALAAAFSPNPTVGQFGRRSSFNPSSLVTGYGPGSPLHGTAPALEGGPAGAFSTDSMSALTLLRQIANGIDKIATTATGRHESRPVQEVGAVVNHALGNSYDAYRPGM